MNKLHADSITKDFGFRRLLSDIFVSCNKGDIVGLLGINGSGKSTLLKIIFGTIKANNKFVRADNKQIVNLQDNIDLIRYLPQEHFLPNHITIKKIILLFCDKESTNQMLANEHVKPHLEKKSRQLSGGERRIVEILLMVYSTAKYLLLDEPFKGLDPIRIEILKDVIREHSTSKGIIITDHDYYNVLDISNKIILICDGITKTIKDKHDLIEYGYLPTGAFGL